MTVHSSAIDVLDVRMPSSSPTDTLPFEAGDPEWVAELIETLRAGDLEAVIALVEELLALMRRAIKARHILATIDPVLLRQGLMVSTGRRDCPR